MTGNVTLRRPPSLADAVVAHIRNEIINGSLPPGHPLSEAQLSEELGTSRGTVREALRELAGLGLVTRTMHKGSVVSVLTPEDAEEIYMLRAALESLAARLAVERGRIDGVALDELSGHVEEMARAGVAGNIKGMVYADMAFHSLLSGLSGAELLIEHLEAIQAHSLRLVVHSDLYRPDFEVVVGRHHRLLEVLRSGDAAAVAAAIEDHIIGPSIDIVANMRQSAPAGEHGADAVLPVGRAR